MSNPKPPPNTTPGLPGLSRTNPDVFIAKWSGSNFSEKQASQEMFLDICALVGHQTPVEHGDKNVFTFEKWVPGGSADAYLEGCFGWEFKGSDDFADPEILERLLTLNLETAGRQGL